MISGWLLVSAIGLSHAPSAAAGWPISAGEGSRESAAGQASSGTRSSLAPRPSSLVSPQSLDDAPEPFQPVRPKTEADQLRIDALTLFAAGRAHQQREEYAEALRCYQRAFRRDPASTETIRAIIAVAVQLDRCDEAVRYALKAVELTDADPLLLHRLGVFLAEDGNWSAAISLYEKALNSHAKKKSPADILLRMEMGRFCHVTGKHQKAADCFAEVARAMEHPEDFSLDEPLKKAIFDEPEVTYQMMGESFLAAGRLDEAKAAFQKLEKLAPHKAQQAFNLARLCLKTGKPADALAALESSFAAHLAAEDEAPYELLAEILARLGKKGELLPRLEKLRAAEPANAPLGSYLASQYAAAGKFDKAESLYRALLKIRPTAAGYRGLADVFRQAKRYDALLSAFGESIGKLGVLETLDMESRSVSGDAAAMQGLEDAAKKSLAKTPDKFDADARLAVALLAMEAEHYKTAGQFFDAALVVNPKQADEVFIVWGAGLISADRAAEAEKVFRRAIDAKPADANPIFYFYLAGALALEDRTDDALKAARTAAEKRKKSARFRGRPAWVLSMGKHRDEAIAEYRKLIDAFDADHASPETRETLRDARLALSDLCAEKGDAAAAEESLEQVLDEFPDDTAAMNDLGFLWADAGKNLTLARRMIEEAVASKPDDPAYRDSLGWVLFRLGKYPEAVVELEKAVAGSKPDGTVLDHLGDAYEKIGRHDKAVEAWRKAAECFHKEKEPEQEQATRKKIPQIAK
jgi:tetratricopeptide (TPR) repeat protein